MGIDNKLAYNVVHPEFREEKCLKPDIQNHSLGKKKHESTLQLASSVQFLLTRARLLLILLETPTFRKH